MLDPHSLRVDFTSAAHDVLPKEACDKAAMLLESHGAFVAAGLISISDLSPIQSGIGNLIHLVSKQVNGAPLKANPGETFDAGFVALNQVDRSQGGLIYNACRRLLPVHHISAHERLAELSRSLMKTKTLMCSNFKAVRIDQPSEDKYLFEWHQDYPYIQDSEDGIVYWIPLHDVDHTNGNVVIAAGSHKLGIQPVRVVDPENKNKNGAASMTLAHPEIVNHFEHVAVPVRQGEVLVFSELLLHRSSPNRTQRARWTLQVRHGNFESQSALDRKWPGGMIEGVGFAERHPEWVENLSELA